MVNAMNKYTLWRNIRSIAVTLFILALLPASLIAYSAATQPIFATTYFLITAALLGAAIVAQQRAQKYREFRDTSPTKASRERVYKGIAIALVVAVIAVVTWLKYQTT